MYNPNRVTDEELDRRAEKIHIKPQYHGIEDRDYSYSTTTWDAITEAYNEYKRMEDWG